MKKLWEKNYKQHLLAEAYCFSDTAVLDNKLIVYDAVGSIAHAFMLSQIGILTNEEFFAMKNCLLEIISLANSGNFMVESSDEDVHTKIEYYLVKKLGALAKKIHTGRSRNDQVLVDLRLYAKEQMLQIASLCFELIDAFVIFGKTHEFIPMPGYTHMQKAMPSSVGMWAGSFAESLLDDLVILETAFDLNNQSPLGSGAAYGVSLPIDRALTARMLGFKGIQNNSLYCQASRGKIQLSLMHALTQIMLTLSRFAEDLLLFTTSEFQFFTVAEELSTGSSIMPQKRNLDVMEILRARAHAVFGQEHTVAAIISGLPSGYNADFGETKLPFMKSIEITSDSLAICELVAQSLSPNVDILQKACTPELYATHQAFLLVKKGIPFREAYKQVGLSLDALPNFDSIQILKESNHIGGPGNLGFGNLKKMAKAKRKWWKEQDKQFKRTIVNLKEGEK